MNGVETQLVGLKWAHALLTMVTADLTPEMAAWIPPGTANPIAAQYAHAVCAEDALIQSVMQGKPPLYAAAWAGRTGVSEPQPMATFEWARTVTIDLAALRDYAAAVADASEAYISGMNDEDLSALVDLSRLDLGMQPIGWVLQANVVGHLNNMAGEISALKGLQGGRGYPF